MDTAITQTRTSAPYPEGPLRNGDRLDQYNIIRRIGWGGIAVVYLAHDSQLGRKVALKVVTAKGLPRRSQRQRFLNEARITACLSHPHIVSVYGMGAKHGLAYVALEYVDGFTLQSRLNQGALGPKRAIEVALAIAQAVAEAHRCGVVHGDLKPANIMIASDGRVRVLDFGLARAGSLERRWTDEPTQSGGILCGTPRFMAPERWLAALPSKEADVWALGALLFELLAGRSAFKGDTLQELFAEICVGAPPKMPDVADRQLASAFGLVARCLQRTPSYRPSAAEVAHNLYELVEAFEIQSSSDLPTRVLGLDFLLSSAPPPQSAERDPTPNASPALIKRAAVYALLTVVTFSLLVGLLWFAVS